MTVVVWKNGSWPSLIDTEVEFFRVSWKDNVGWIRDEKGPYWGFEHPDKGRIVYIRGNPEDQGLIVEPTIDIEVKLDLGRPTLEIVEEEED